ncbi:MAG: precorrin-6y C5,15-methyltransferase (decarboxylating) subunit CbiE [Firmicutes bacterium]|nr:precorrin-6y C5,15-methyltransferase (decarboxylating) subunit CbiE [Bacillota bacterium]
MKVILAGTGCGSPGSMTVEVREAILQADLLIGAKRLLESIPFAGETERIAAIYPEEIMDAIRQAQQERAAADAAAASGDGAAAEAPQICVLYSGDSGFYSGTRSLQPVLKEAGIEAEILPGISSIQVFAARLGQPWQDWRLVSAHGTDCDAVAEVMQGRPVFFLTGGRLGPAELARQLTEAGLGALELAAGERLTYEDERIMRGTAEEFTQMTFAPLSVMLAQPAPWAGDLTPGIRDGAFIRGDVPMTKQTVRAAILSEMQVREEDIVWDVGAGTGSVSVELAMKARRGRVYAVERDRDGSILIRQNREKFGVWNLCPVDGAAPQALSDLPKPDKVFIGGSGGTLKEILGIALGKNGRVRICVSAIVLETMQEAVQVMSAAGMEVQIRQVAVSAAKALGKRHMMTAENPIFIITGQRREESGE